MGAPLGLTADKARFIGRLRDALATLGYAVPKAPIGSPGTLAHLAEMGPAVGKFIASLGPEFAASVRALEDGMTRAKVVTEAAEAKVAQKFPVQHAAEKLVGGFFAYREGKKKGGPLAGVVSAFVHLNAASRR